MNCTYCGNPITTKSKFCIKCGQKIDQRSLTMPRFCPKCGNSLLPSDIFCDECGTQIEKSKIPRSSKLSLKDLTGCCFLCGFPIPPKIILCPRCDVRLNCFKCGQPLSPGKTFSHSYCPKCGHKKINKKLLDRSTYYRSLPPLNPSEILTYYD